MRTVEVDRSACEGAGYCEKVAPKVFRVDDEEKSEVLLAEVPDDLAEAVEEAEALCPTLAIRQRKADGEDSS